MKKKLLIILPAFIICFVLIVSQAKEPISKSIQRAYSDANFDIDVDQILQKFKKTLVSNQVLTKEELNSTTAIYDKLSAIEESVNPLDLGIQGVIDKNPFEEFISNIDILSLNEASQVNIALFTYYQLFSSNFSKFELILTEKRLLEFKGDNVPINSLEAVLFEEIERLAYRNVTTKNTRIVIKAEPGTPNEFVTFILKQLAQMGLSGFTFGR
ncbi:hypothetical protein [Roseivirga sp.]|uniref:hypothetical protein n=1 Tax=Roseivirga sp. TaxID=1964215 RepID=UPI003B8BC62C